MSSVIKFGTDGWRGIIAEDFTFENVRTCAQGVADYLHDVGLAHQGLVVGYDTRFASEDFAAAAAEVVAANGIRVYLCQKASPTPVISHSILMQKAGGAIIITASHNPASWNGFKYRVEQAAAASPEVLVQLEKYISVLEGSGTIKRMPLEQAIDDGMVQRFDPALAYIRHIGGLVDLERLRRSGLKVVVDSMYGAGIGYLSGLLNGDATEVIEIHGERNPLFPGLRPEPIGPNLGELCATVRESGASVGLATDGDADRLGVVDEHGNYITTLHVFALLALYLLEVRGQRGAIVKTITSSAMLDRLGEIHNVPVHETPVGFKYVAPKMTSEDALIGGEESGGYAFRGHILERDGILSGLFFLDLMVREQKAPSQLIDHLFSKVGPHHYNRVDFEFPPEERQAVTNRLSEYTPSIVDNTSVREVRSDDGFRFLLADGSWFLIRFSGTEPLLRIYAESDSPERVSRLIAEGRRISGV